MIFCMCNELINRLPYEFECVITIILKRLDVVRLTYIRRRCDRSKRYQVTFPLPDDLLMLVHLEVCQVLRLGLLNQLSFVVLEFLLTFSRQVLQSQLHDVAWEEFGVILRTSHLGAIFSRSRHPHPQRSRQNVCWL